MKGVWALRWDRLTRLIVILTLVITLLSIPELNTLISVNAGEQLQGGRSLRFDEPVTGSLDDDLFRQVYTFVGLADEIIAIRMTRVSGDLDVYLLLMDENGGVLALSDDEGPGVDAEIEFKHIPAEGRYYVIATRFGQELGSTAGEYELLLERVGAGASEDTVLQYGDSVLGHITADEAQVFHFLRAQRSEVINVSMRRMSGDLDPRVDLVTAEGVVLVSNDDDPRAEGTLDAGIVNYTIQTTGIYLIVATRFGGEAGDTEGNYVLSVSQTPLEELGTRPEEARLIDYGMTLAGTIDDDVPLRYFRFDARRGDVITVTLSAAAGKLDPVLKLADANRMVLEQDDNSGDGKDARIAAFTLSASGTYYLLATRDGEFEGKTEGDFSLQLTGRAGVVGGRALEITYGATVSGLIEDGHAAEEYVFFGQQGDVITVSMERASDDLDALITVYDSDRKQIGFDDDGGADQNSLLKGFVLPEDGMYILVASRFDRELGETSGAYILMLELIRAGQ